jgi:hypothetical protein
MDIIQAGTNSFATLTKRLTRSDLTATEVESACSALGAL